MRLDLRFLTRKVEDLWCEAIVVPVIQRVPLISGMIGRIDRKLTGYLARLEGSGFLTGKIGETLLIPSEDKIRSHVILLKGMGRLSEIDNGRFSVFIQDSGVIMSNMKIMDWGIHLPEEFVPERELKVSLQESLMGVINAYKSLILTENESLLKIIFSVPEDMLRVINGFRAQLKISLRSFIDLSIVVSER